MQHPEEMYAEFKLADEAGLQLITHAIGDRANRRDSGYVMSG